MRASVPPPLACKASALPSELIPLHAPLENVHLDLNITIALQLHRGIAMVNKSLENVGIDPTASRMLSEHSTIWANSPLAEEYQSLNHQPANRYTNGVTL